MIYFQTTDQKHVLIVTPDALEELKKGNALISSDHLVFVALTPDEDWTAEQFRQAFATGDKKLTAERMNEILVEGMQRPDPRLKT